MKGRPEVPESFFDRIFEYHGAHGGKFNVVNDVGASIGNYSPRLAKRFSTVIITEPDDKSRSIAEKNLNKNIDATTKYLYVKAGAEDQVQEPGSVDFVFCTNTLNHCDLDKSLEAFAKQLRSGGTFLMGMFGYVHFFDKEVNRVWEKLFSVFREDWLAANRAKWGGKGWNAMHSGGNELELSSDTWFPVQRLRLNCGGDETFSVFREFPEHFKSLVGLEDELISEVDSDWYFEADLAQLKVMFHSIPWKGHEEEEDALWQEMESILGGGTAKGYWPAGIVLATRK